jgi:hypothetical protein
LIIDRETSKSKSKVITNLEIYQTEETIQEQKEKETEVEVVILVVARITDESV